MMMNKTVFLFLIAYTSLLRATSSEEALFSSLDQQSISEHVAFYSLYKEKPIGKKALKEALILLRSESPFPTNLAPFLELTQGRAEKDKVLFSEEALTFIDLAARILPNRKLKGYGIDDDRELLLLKDEEVDLLQALTREVPEEKKKQLKALVDLMALQVLARLPAESCDEDKVQEITKLIFFDMKFRFPPHSTFSQDIDRYTLLPSVIEERRGVCLGVSLLYLCLAQRIDLPLEIVTPPGHIYIRSKYNNIETTMRGVHLPDEEYLGMNLKCINCRPFKEALGLSYVNLGSQALYREKFQEACLLYQKASLFCPNDPLVEQLLGITYQLLGKDLQAREHLQKSLELNDDLISKDTLAQDLLDGNVDKEAIKPLFFLIDDTRYATERKKNALEESCKKYPAFKSGLFHLAICYLQLQSPKDAIITLEKLHTIDQTDITVEYLLACLYLERNTPEEAKKHLRIALNIASKAGRSPRILRELKQKLFYTCP